jgi:hypothetical protein
MKYIKIEIIRSVYKNLDEFLYNYKAKTTCLNISFSCI